MSSCDDMRLDLGAYALGALAPQESAALERHLAGCPPCRAELEELASVSALLRTTAARGALAEEEEAAAERALARLGDARRKERRRLRAAAAAAGAGLVSVAALSAALLSSPRDAFAPEGSPLALAPALGVAATADATFSSRPWGTQVDLAAERMPTLEPGEYFQVWLVRGNGTRVAAGTFRPSATGDGAARVRLAAAVPLTDVVRIGITRNGTGSSRPVLQAPVVPPS